MSPGVYGRTDEDPGIAKEWLRNLWHNHAYLQLLINYLSGHCSKEEFQSQAASFARPVAEVTPQEISRALHALSSIVKQPLTAFEVSIFLNCDPLQVQSVMDAQRESQE